MKLDDVDFELADEGKSYIIIDDDMRLVMSPRNWQLQKKLVAGSDTKTQKKGDVSWASFKYYMTLESAINDIIHIKTSKEFFNTAEGLLKANEKVVKEVCKAFSPTYTITVND